MPNVIRNPPLDQTDPIYKEDATAYTPHLGRKPTPETVVRAEKVIDKLLDRNKYKGHRKELR